jgi:two-component system OmpR family response regulator
MSAKRQYRLLMIDDDASLNELLVEYFERFDHKVATATTAANGRYLMRRDDPDLLILDVMLPDADGMELCRAIRAESDIPIVMLTARGDVPDRVLGLEFGADDYMPKPFEPREHCLELRIP